MPMMGLREYSRHRGCNLKAVQKALAAGRISKVGDKIDSEAADAAWAANTDPLAAHRDYAKAANGSANGHAAGPDAQSLIKTKSEIAALDLKRKQRQEELDAGRLVPVEEFEQRLATVISTSRTKVLSLPSKIKSHLPHLTMKDVATIDRLVRESLEELANVGTS